MHKRIFLFFLFLISASHVNAQKKPEVYREVIVDQKGKGDFETLQAAINSCRDFGPGYVKIKIKNGIYEEKIVVPSWKHKILLEGESREGVIITNNDHSYKEIPGSNKKINTFTSYTFQVMGNDIVLENLSIENVSCNEGQAVALHVEGDRFQAIDLNITGCQDTLYAATEKSRQFYYNCYIAGTTDFIFGSATVVFQNCEIRSLSNSYITAASTTKNKDYGFVFMNCKFTAGNDVNEVYLGRPWRPFAKTVILNSELGAHIRPEGWNPWKGDEMFPQKEKTAFYAEYGNTGPGSGTANRVQWAELLTKEQASEYSLSNIFGTIGSTWNPLQFENK